MNLIRFGLVNFTKPLLFFYKEMLIMTYFKGTKELKIGWVCKDEDYEKVQEQMDLLRAAKYRAEFMFKCLYKGERPLSKEDYARTRRTHSEIRSKLNGLAQVRTETQHNNQQKGMRKLKIQKGIYPTGLSWEEALQDEEIKRFYETGRYKRGSFVARFIVPLNRF